MLTDRFMRGIDSMSYRDLLQFWRHGSHDMVMFGEYVFQGDETVDYYKAVMARKRAEIGPDAAVAASKSVDW